MRRTDDTRSGFDGGIAPGTFGVLAGVAEEVVVEPENLEGALRRMVVGLREGLGLRALTLSASVTEGRGLEARSGVAGGTAAELPILRGKKHVGTLRAYPGSLDDGRREVLRAAAGVAALALDAAYAREVAAQKTAQGSVVQIASEALGVIKEEGDLYRTVLVLTLELLDASGGAILLGDGGVVSLGFEGSEETLEALREVRFLGRSPWMGRIGGHHLLGVGLGGDEGAVFLTRPTRPYTEAEGVSLKLVARQLARARERSRLYASLERTSTEAISALAAALESRDDTTGEHIRRTQALAGEVAEEIGLRPEGIRVVKYAAMLHDIGKIGIPDSILNKPGGLTQEEWRAMRRHPATGADIIGRIAGFENVVEAVLAHHERHDGRGYPAGLAGDEVPVAARLISVIDAYDAMTNDRPYRRAMTHEEALAEIERGSGTQFDPAVVEALKTVLHHGRK
ncbi:HD domain-containing protein [Rubrobacter marinus]|uniref:HD domain-containing protein n=1 Tax=Rubrobacter marinus TaxID=2653852 RepID=A0A6G8PUF5_9ACTN|nr:HD domain-containing phosphohydrolase [Rubrobacter marinus]QIN77355.1 HD domain-containing protein [Rubrobacter marinus]